MLAVLMLGAVGWLRHGSRDHQEVLDYALSLFAVGLLPLLSALAFRTLGRDAGADLRPATR